MKPSKEIYDKILPLCPKDYEEGFMRIPGVYCAGCGETFALYSYSVIPPCGFDENQKPYYTGCFRCPGATSQDLFIGRMRTLMSERISRP